jgi:fatty-acyl-CoA synthase
VPVSVPVGIGGKDAYLEQLRRQLAASGAVAAVGIEDLAGFLADAPRSSGRAAARRVSGIDALPEKPVDLGPLGPPTSATSSSRRAARAIRTACRSPGRADGQSRRHHRAGRPGSVAGDRAASWLPLYHDMGLIGFLMAPLSTQLSLDYLTPRDFARRPTQWLNLISQQSATIAYSPSFGYDLATRRPRARCRPISTCRAGAMPASAAT